VTEHIDLKTGRERDNLEHMFFIKILYQWNVANSRCGVATTKFEKASRWAGESDPLNQWLH